MSRNSMPAYYYIFSLPICRDSTFGTFTCTRVVHEVIILDSYLYCVVTWGVAQVLLFVFWTCLSSCGHFWKFVKAKHYFSGWSVPFRLHSFARPICSLLSWMQQAYFASTCKSSIKQTFCNWVIIDRWQPDRKSHLYHFFVFRLSTIYRVCQKTGAT